MVMSATSKWLEQLEDSREWRSGEVNWHHYLQPNGCDCGPVCNRIHVCSAESERQYQ